MRTFRAKLIAIVAVDAFALLALVLLSMVIEGRVGAQLASIQRHQVPRIGLQPRLEATMTTVADAFEDAASANDLERLDDVRGHEREFIAQIAGARDAIDPADAAALRAALADYIASAQAITRRIIADDSGEDFVDDMREMQVHQARVVALIALSTRFDEEEMGRAFAAAAAAQRTGAKIRLALSAACVVLVLLLTIWIGRSLFRTLDELAAGFRRFGDGDFAIAIPATARDELGVAAGQANQMASRLQRLMAERDDIDWLKGGQAGLTESLRGELEPDEVADRALAFLARYLEAPTATLYYAADDGALVLLGHHGVEPGAVAPPIVWSETGSTTELTIVGDRVRLPLLHLGNRVGVVELDAAATTRDQAAELLQAVRDSLTITIEVARARAATRALLAKTQRQAAELQDVRTGLVQQAEQLTRTSAYKSQFLANMSHELRTPLNAIIGFSELLHDRDVHIEPVQQHEFLGHVLDSGRHLLQLINDVLDLSKVEAGKLDFTPEPISVQRTVEAVLSILRTIAASRQIRIVATVDPAVDEVVLDPGRLKQVLYNLLSNALKFTGEGGRVDVRVSDEGDQRFRLEVADTGVGIRPEDLERLFVEFQQVGSDTRHHAGTGLGLALTKRLVEAQGGSVGVRSTIGEGSTFHVILPRRSTIAAAPVMAMLTAVAVGAPSVLVIEDDATDQRILATALGKAGYAVELATSGAAALALTGARRFDAITLDLLLPDMTGLDVLRQVRATGENQHTPIVIVTVIAERGDIAGFAVQDVLTKPLDADALLAALMRADVAPSAARGVMIVDDDPTARELMARTLHRLGYRTRCEADAVAALETVRHAAPSAIVLDLLMPAMSGFEFLERLRGQPHGHRVPVIVWTAKELSRDEHLRLRATASAVVAKSGGGTDAVIAELAAYLPVGPAA